MTAQTSRERSARGRVLLVDAVSDGSIPEFLVGRIQHAANMFDAVGQISTSTARNPVEAVVVHAAQITRSLDVVVEAIRTVDPSILLYLLLESESDTLGDAAIDAGFDGLLVAPLTGTMLGALLNDEEAYAPLANRQSEQKDIEPTSPEPSSDLASTDPITAEPHAPAGDGDTTSLGDVAPTSPLGDSDLVHAVLKNPESTGHLAIQLLRQETGWVDASVADDEGSTPITYGSAQYGYLSCSLGTDAEHRAWAQWLSGWLHLAHEHAGLQELVNRDVLTGAWNRRYFESYLPDILDEARRERRIIPVMVFDIDNLKKYNDCHGHDAGDQVLRETVALIRSMVRQGDRVCRIGGDEFVVVFADREAPRKPGSVPLRSVESVIRRFQTAISELDFPRLGPDAPGPLSISAGLATFPWDGHDAETLVRLADQLALESKRRGKNTLTIGHRPG